MNIERIQAIYEAMGKMTVTLDPDPRALGPTYLQNMIATTRNHLNSVGQFQMEVHRERQTVARHLHAETSAYEVQFAEALAGDPRIARLPSIEDRKQTINVLLRVPLDRISALKAQLQDLDYVDKAVRFRHRELTATMTEIKLQRSLIRDEMESGAMYGDERKEAHERGYGPLGQSDPIDEAELATLLEDAVRENGVGLSAPAQVVVEDAPAPTPTVEEVEEAAVETFLHSGPAAAVKVEENYDDVFENI